MKELQEEYNMGILFITHDLGVIAELADEVVVMYKGKLVEKGPALQVFSNPNHPYTRGLLACRPPLDVRVRELPTRKYFMTEDEDGVIVETGKTVSEVIKELAVSKNEVSLRHEIIYAQESLLEVNNLKTYFPNKKSFFW
jgi:peptide/nickel transport system ATP-binding protein